MHWDFSSMIRIFNNDCNYKLLLDGLWGIEREAQRVKSLGELALTPHPPAFGSKLKNPNITTDFAESQIELVTPPYTSVEQAHASLTTIQTVVEKEIAKNLECLWPLSMPPRLPDEDEIPIAQYGTSQDAKEREVYRNGLAVRYGKKMQMISGIHYNYSLGNQLSMLLYQQLAEGLLEKEFANRLHFALARNFLRNRWLLIYLFGASPNVDETYHSVICKEIELIKKKSPDCYKAVLNFEKYATSLRVSRYGYANVIEQKHMISFNSLEEYIKDIRKLMRTKSDTFSEIGLFQYGQQIQLNDNVLQKENEFYSSIRLKADMQAGESQLDALEKRGVSYVEVRILDNNPYERVGISLEQLYFMQVFMLFCLFEGSEDISDDDVKRMIENHHLVAMTGREENLQLRDARAGNRTVVEWSKEIFQKLITIASLMDMGSKTNRYQSVVEREYMKIEDSRLLPSAKISAEMQKNKQSFIEFGIDRMDKNQKKSF